MSSLGQTTKEQTPRGFRRAEKAVREIVFPYCVLPARLRKAA